MCYKSSVLKECIYQGQLKDPRVPCGPNNVPTIFHYPMNAIMQDLQDP